MVRAMPLPFCEYNRKIIILLGGFYNGCNCTDGKRIKRSDRRRYDGLQEGSY